MTTADNVVTFRIAVKAIAAKYGLHATFMPKPIFGINGSGMHCNISLANTKGKNAFYDPKGEYQLSDTARYAIGGILKHIKSITAILNPTVNSYKRIVPGYEAPVYMAWSLANRSALLRVPAKRGVSTRVELRSPDPSCNPYLAFATILAACLDGVRNKIEPPKPVESNIYKLSEKERKRLKIESLPGSLKEALDYMQKSLIAKTALGSHILEEFTSTKERYRSSPSTVSRWASRLSTTSACGSSIADTPPARPSPPSRPFVMQDSGTLASISCTVSLEKRSLTGRLTSIPLLPSTQSTCQPIA